MKTTKNRSSGIFLRGKLKILSPPGSALGLDGLSGPRTETKFTKWSVSLKRLRTAGLIYTIVWLSIFGYIAGWIIPTFYI